MYSGKLYCHSVSVVVVLSVLFLIDWCLMPTLEIFQLYCGVNKFYLLNSSFTRHLEIKKKNRFICTNEIKIKAIKP
jgi:hypothetical protein